METRFALSLVATIGFVSCQAAPSAARLVRVGDPSSLDAAKPELSTAPERPQASAPAGAIEAAPVVAADDSYELGPVIDDEDEWRFVIAPYAWLLQLDGNTEVDGTVSRIDEDFSDLFDKLNFVAEGRLEAWKGEWGALLDFTYANIEDDAKAGPTSADIETDVIIAFSGLLHNFIDRPADENGVGGLKVDGFLGVAYTSIDINVDVSGGPNGSKDESWVDPIVGMRSRFTFSENWGASLQFDIGGFEAFNGSELTAMTTALMGRGFGKGRILYFGWRTLFIDYSEDFELDLTVNGPIMGFEWSF